MPNKQEIRWMIGALAGINLGNIAIFTAPIYIGSLMDSFGFTENQTGLISTLEIGAVAVTCLLLSRWLGSFSLQKLAMTGAIATLIINVITISLNDYVSILLSRTLAGVGAGLCLAATSALLSRMKDPDQIVGIMLAVNTVIMVIVIGVLGYVKAAWQFPGIMAVFAINVIVFLPLLLLLPSQPLKHSRANRREPSAPDHRLGLGILGVSLLFLFCTVEGGVWAFAERSGSNLGIADGDIGLLLATAQVAGLAGAIIAAVWGSKIPRLYPIVIGSGLMGLAGLFIYQTDSQLIYGLFLGAFSFGFFIAFPYMIGACARLDADGRWAARANGINLLGGAIAPIIAALIITSSDYQALGTFCFCLAGFCMVLAVIFNRELNKANINDELGPPGKPISIPQSKFGT